MGIKNKENFRYYYKLAVSNNRPPCGSGSDIEIVKKFGTIEFIDSLIERYNITSINDCPCGVFNNWMCFVGLDKVKYSGYDINDLVITRNIEEVPLINFVEFDMVNEVLPYADLIICRDCFFHLPDSFIIKSIKNFRMSTSRYLLATNHNHVQTNINLTPKELEKEAGYRFLNLSIHPFNLGEPIEYHVEHIQESFQPQDTSSNRQLSLWKL